MKCKIDSGHFPALYIVRSFIYHKHTYRFEIKCMVCSHIFGKLFPNYLNLFLLLKPKRSLNFYVLFLPLNTTCNFTLSVLEVNLADTVACWVKFYSLRFASNNETSPRVARKYIQSYTKSEAGRRASQAGADRLTITIAFFPYCFLLLRSLCFCSMLMLLVVSVT